jgi:two-component system, NarL family, sensor kinase
VSREAMELARQNRLGYEYAKTCNNIANVFNFMGEFDSSMTYFLKAAMVFERIGRTEHLNVIYQNIGSVYLSLGQYEQSIAYTEKSIAISRQRGDSMAVARALTNLGGALVSVNRKGEALAAFQRCLEICKTFPDPYIENLAHVGLGNVYTQMKRYDEAGQVLGAAIQTAREMNYTSNLANALNAMAMVQSESGKFRLADQYLTEAVDINESYKVYYNLLQQYKLIAEIRTKTGQFASAYDFLQKYMTLHDSLSGIEAQKNVAELEKKYESAQKDKKIYESELRIAEGKLQIELQEKLNRQKNTWLIIAVGIVALLILGIVFVYYVLLQQKKQHQQRIAAIQKEQELMQLKARLEGEQQERQRIAREMHDEIGSGLSTILYLSHSLGTTPEKAGKVPEIARTLMTQMNEIIWSMNSEQDHLDDFVAYVRHQTSQFLDSVEMDYRFEIPGHLPDLTISGMKRRNIYLVIKEALHNAVKHSGADMVIVKMDFSAGIFISIADNGRGVPASAQNPFGNGMKNMQHRIDQVGGELTVRNENGFAIEIRMSLTALP